MIYMTFLVVDIVLAICIVSLILLHRGRGADVGVAFGGGASGTVFGAKGATSFLGKLIAILATIFILNSLLLAYIANRDFTDKGIIETIEGMPAPVQAVESDAPETSFSDEAMEQTGTQEDLPVTESP